jgi:hypothetical protein
MAAPAEKKEPARASTPRATGKDATVPKVVAEVSKKLREPFPASAVGKLPRKNKKTGRTIELDYVGHAHVTERLLDVDPDWTWEPYAYEPDGKPSLEWQGDQPVGMWIKLTVGGMTKPGYGSVPPGKQEAVKELIGDAIRNAAMRMGVALDLWKKEDTRARTEDEVESDDSGTPERPARRRPAPEGPPEWMQNLIDNGISTKEILEEARLFTKERADAEGRQANPIRNLGVLAQAPQEYVEQLVDRLLSKRQEPV